MEVTKLSTEAELQQQLNVEKLACKMLLQNQRKMEEQMAKMEQQVEAKAEVKNATIAKLKKDVQALTEDLKTVETTFAYFHKRYEQSKGKLEVFQDNEEVLKTKVKELEQENQYLQDSIQKAHSETKNNEEVLKTKVKELEHENQYLQGSIQKAHSQSKNSEEVLKTKVKKLEQENKHLQVSILTAHSETENNEEVLKTKVKKLEQENQHLHVSILKAHSETKNNEEILKTKAKELEQGNQYLKDIEKAHSETTLVKKNSEAQLKKAELKISSLENPKISTDDMFVNYFTPQHRRRLEKLCSGMRKSLE